MSKYQFVLDQLGLQSLRPRVYQVDDDETAAHPFEEPDLSILGTPVFSRVSLADSKDATKNIVLDAALVDLSMDKNIVSTPVTGKKGTFKEYVADGDYSITIKGVIFSKDDSYPLEEMNKLIAVCQSPNSLKVSSEFLSLFKIYNLVIKNYSLGQSEKQGYLNIQPFTLTCMSDQPVALRLK